MATCVVSCSATCSVACIPLQAACRGTLCVADVCVPGLTPSCCRDCAEAPICGVPGADFVVFVTARPTDICQPTTTAHAVTCVIDSTRSGSIYGLRNRPLAGHVNFCPSAGRGGMTAAEPRSLEAVVDTAVHELMHALFMSAGLYSLYPGDAFRCAPSRVLAADSDGTSSAARRPRCWCWCVCACSMHVGCGHCRAAPPKGVCSVFAWLSVCFGWVCLANTLTGTAAAGSCLAICLAAHALGQGLARFGPLRSLSQVPNELGFG